MTECTEKWQKWLCLALAALVVSCSGSGEEKTAEDEEKSGDGVTTVMPDMESEVSVQVLKARDFEHELVSNGKLVASQQADLKFETQGVVAAIYVKNGERVRKGQKLAELDKFALTRKVAQARDAVEQARLQMQDVLIGQGYAADDSAKVPADIMRLGKNIVRVKTGVPTNFPDAYAFNVAADNEWLLMRIPQNETNSNTGIPTSANNSGGTLPQQGEGMGLTDGVTD